MTPAAINANRDQAQDLNLLLLSTEEAGLPLPSPRRTAKPSEWEGRGAGRPLKTVNERGRKIRGGGMSGHPPQMQMQCEITSKSLPAKTSDQTLHTKKANLCNPCNCISSPKASKKVLMKQHRCDIGTELLVSQFALWVIQRRKWD
jgi:hypothetical protein